MNELEILYRDKLFVACVKPAGVLSQESEREINMPALLAGQLSAPYVAAVHRLDRPVGGVMLYSLNPAFTGKLTAMLSDKALCRKEYLAVLHGTPVKSEGVLTDLLYHDARINKTFVADRMRKGVREASLFYRTLASDGEKSLVRICLYTGRTHQIRVQFSSRGLPLVGDGRYGGGKGETALFSYRLSFRHPVSGKDMTFERLPKGEAFCQFEIAHILEKDDLQNETI